MGRAPCCDKAKVKRGPWSPEEDAKLKDYIHNYGTGNNWIALPHKAGLKRCGKSCRLRWLNYLRPNIKHGDFSDEEDTIICTLFAAIGSRWSIIAAQLPGRTDNDIKNYWNTKLKKKLMGMSNTIINNPQLPSVLHNSPSPDSNSLLLSSSPPFHYYNAPPSASLSPTGFDQAPGGLLVNSPNGLTNTSASTAGGYSNYLVCGSAQQPSYSYTSSDGSYSNINQYDHQGMGFQNNTTSFSLGETPALLGYGLEEIKQLVSTTTNNTATSAISSSSQNGDGSNSNSFYFDENSTMHYYY